MRRFKIFRTLLKENSVSKRLYKETPIVDGSEYLYCVNADCYYTYEFWNNPEKKNVEFERWYDEHVEEITFGIDV